MLGRAIFQIKNGRLLQTSRYLILQSSQWKIRNNVWNMFKVNNKDTKTTSMTSVFTVNCEHGVSIDVDFDGPILRVGSTCLKATKPIREEKLLLIANSPAIPGSDFIDLERMKT